MTGRRGRAVRARRPQPSTPPRSGCYAEGDDIGLVRGLMLSVGFMAISVGLVASVVSLLLRLRRSTAEQRQQLRLIALAAALIAARHPLPVRVQLVNGGEQTWLAGLPLFVAYFLLPILFAIAVLRHRLYELDVIINRTVVLVAGTAFAALGYTTLVVTVGRLVEGRAGGFWLSLLGTALVALAFQPLRRSVVRLANRLAYGSRAQPYEALADFSSRLAEAPSPGTLLPAVAEAAARSVSADRRQRHPRRARQRPGLRHLGLGERRADHAVPVRTEGRDLGHDRRSRWPRGRALRPAPTSGCSRPSPTRPLSRSATPRSRPSWPSTSRSWTGRPGGSRESRLRLVEADDAARRTLEAAIARDVLPHLTALPDGIRRVRATSRAARPIGHRPAGRRARTRRWRRCATSPAGVFPTQLARAGLGPALRSLVTAATAPATLASTERSAPVLPARRDGRLLLLRRGRASQDTACLTSR